MSEDIKPFRVAVPKADLDELAARLASWPDELPEAGWDYASRATTSRTSPSTGVFGTTNARKRSG
jgi:hypothetical protein